MLVEAMIGASAATCLAMPNDEPRSVTPKEIVQVRGGQELTPSSFDRHVLVMLEYGTGAFHQKMGPESVVDKAFGFMEAISNALPYSDEADRRVTELANRLHGERDTVPIL